MMQVSCMKRCRDLPVLIASVSMSGKKIIAVIAGGDSSEDVISYKSGAQVWECLDRERFEPYLVVLHGTTWRVNPTGADAAGRMRPAAFFVPSGAPCLRPCRGKRHGQEDVPPAPGSMFRPQTFSRAVRRENKESCRKHAPARRKCALLRREACGRRFPAQEAGGRPGLPPAFSCLEGCVRPKEGLSGPEKGRRGGFRAWRIEKIFYKIINVIK